MAFRTSDLRTARAPTLSLTIETGTARRVRELRSVARDSSDLCYGTCRESSSALSMRFGTDLFANSQSGVKHKLRYLHPGVGTPISIVFSFVFERLQ